MSLQEELDAHRTATRSNFPPGFATIIGQTVADLIASSQADRALKVGDLAPAFDLRDQDGAVVSSSDLLRKGPLVLSFYRGVWCPLCNIELKALQAALGEITARGAVLVAISQQTQVNNRKTRRENSLTFPILSDKDGDVGAGFGLRWTLPEAMREVHRKLGGPLPAFNGEDSWTLPIPARYAIAQDGVIAYSEVSPDYSKRPEPSDLFPVLDSLNHLVSA